MSGHDKKPDPKSETTRQRAAALTWARGCVTDNPCWGECYETALDTIIDGDLDDWERSVATVEQYRKYTGKRTGPTPPDDLVGSEEKQQP